MQYIPMRATRSYVGPGYADQQGRPDLIFQEDAMSPHDSPTPANTPPTSLRSFSRKEAERLSVLRQRYQLHGEYFERVIDERRLEFARWLAEQRRLSED